VGGAKIDTQSHFVTDWLDKRAKLTPGRVAAYKLPRAIYVLDALPLTAIGKIDKKRLSSKEPLE
jgi:non-ribosomal peptide synthetase component E (peptide arylation enzyme)